MPDLPKLEDLDPATPPGASDPATPADRSTVDTAQPEASPPPGFPRVGTLVTVAVLTGLMLYGTAGFLREAGLFDVRQWWTPPPAWPHLAGVENRSGVAPPVVAPTAPVPTPSVESDSRPLRDQPPRLPPLHLPQFTVRDGERYDFLTDLDAETLKRLAEIQGQLDGFGAQVRNLNQAVQVLAQHAGQQRQQEVAHQNWLQQQLAATRREIAALHTTVGEVEARLKRVGSGLGRAALGTGGNAVPSGPPVAAWSVKAVSGDRAWLRTPQGREVTVIAGDQLKALGTVRAVDAIQKIVVLGDGRVVR